MFLFFSSFYISSFLCFSICILKTCFVHVCSSFYFIFQVGYASSQCISSIFNKRQKKFLFNSSVFQKLLTLFHTQTHTHAFKKNTF